jgi:hypothetical protein
MRAIEHGLRGRGLACEELVRRNVGVPRDDRRYAAEARDRLPIPRPDFRRHRRAVGVDDARTAGIEARELDLCIGVWWHCVEVGHRVDAVIAGVHVDVVDVEQEATTRTRGNRGDELALGHCALRKRVVARDVLDQDAPPEVSLDRVDARADVAQRFVGVWQRKQVVVVAAVDAAPAQMLRNRRGFDAARKPVELGQVRHVERVGRP